MENEEGGKKREGEKGSPLLIRLPAAGSFTKEREGREWKRKEKANSYQYYFSRWPASGGGFRGREKKEERKEKRRKKKKKKKKHNNTPSTLQIPHADTQGGGKRRRKRAAA